MQDPLHSEGAAHRRPVLACSSGSDACSSAGSDYAAFRAALPPPPVVAPGSRGDSVFRVDFGPIAACVVLAILMLLSPPCAAVLVCVLAGWFARELAARARARKDSLPPATDDTRHGALPARGVGGKM